MSDHDRASLAVHVPASDDFPAIIRNVTNLRTELGDTTVIEVVAHGAGLDLVLASGPVASDVRDLLESGTRFVACGNTMSRRGVDVDALVPGVNVVPAGLAELARLQWEGYAYVRP